MAPITLDLQMNEIDTLTAKDGSDLVRIARPLETAAAERKLSEELSGFEAIISDAAEERHETRDIPSQTGTVGEEKDNP